MSISELDRLERDVEALQAEMAKLGVRSALLEQKLDAIFADIVLVKSTISDKYVTVARYGPVERIVFGLVALILLSAVGAMLAQVIA